MKTGSHLCRIPSFLLLLCSFYIPVNITGQSAPVFTPIENQTIIEGGDFESINLDNFIYDPDNSVDELIWSYSEDGELSVSIEDHTAVISVPDENWFGSESIAFLVSDPDFNISSDTAIFSVLAVNDAPVVDDIPGQGITEGGSFVSVFLDDYVTDIDNNMNDLAWTYTGDADLNIAIDALHYATIEAPDAWTGTETILFTVQDTEGLTDSDDAMFTVSARSSAPVADNDSYSVDEGMELSTPAPGVLSNDSDADGDLLTAVLVAGPTYSPTFDLNEDGSFVYNHSGAESENDVFTYKVSDGTAESGVATVFITINPVNDSPEFTNIPPQEIAEGESFDLIDLTLFVSDPDNTNNELTWAVDPDDNLVAMLDEVTHVATVEPENAGWNGTGIVTFTVTDPGDKMASQNAMFTVTAVNEAPIAVDDAGFTIDEGMPLTVEAPGVLTNDADTDGDDLTAMLVTGPDHSSAFNLSDNGSFSYTHDGSETESDAFTYRASDGSAESNDAIVTINVLPVNDAPVIQGIPDLTIKEGDSFDPIDLDDYIADADNDVDDLDLTASSSPNLNVTINEANHHASIVPIEDSWNGSETITFTVTDPDKASASDDAVFSVSALATAPTDIFLSATAVAENQPTVTYIGTLSTEDADPGDTFDYTFASGEGDADNGFFDISVNTFRTNATFNFEARSSYSVRIRSTGIQDGQSFEKAFTITITDVNEAPTDISLSSTSIAENLSVNALVGNLTATDPDAGSNFTYSLVAGTGSTDNGSFNIAGTQLRSSAIFDYETKSTYSIRLSVSDGTLTFEEPFTILVTFANVAPTDITLSSNTILENQAINTVVGTLSTTDPNASDSHVYTLVSGTGSTDNASFNILGTQLRATSLLDYESKSAYSVRIRSTDNNSLYIEKVFTVTVINQNEPPSDLMLSSNSIAEHLPANTIVGNLSATDPDAESNFTYSFVTGTGSTDNGSFNLAGTQLRSSAIFDYETKSTYSIRLSVSDGTLSLEEPFTILVTYANGAPTDITLLPSTIAENQPVNTVVGNLSSTDPNAGDSHTYSLVPGAGSTDNASFNISNSQLRSSSIFDLESKSSYAIRIRSTDGGSLFFEKVFTITVTNVNEPPVASNVNYTSDGRIGVTHTGSYDFTDPDGDNPGTHTYKWFISDNQFGVPATAITGATNNSYTPVLTDGGKYICFEITPVDQYGLAGTPARSAFKLINEVPVASNVHVYAPAALPGETIRGRFTYADAENNPRGNAIYQWYRSNASNPTPGSPGTLIGTDSTYLLKNADAGKYIWFRVEPVAITGSTPGSVVWSNVIGPIGTFSANITGSGNFCPGTTMPVTLTITAGKSPYTAVLTRSGSISNKDTSIFNIPSSPYTIQVKVAGSYVLKSLTDANSDEATVTTTPVLLVINPKSKALLTGTAAICNDGTSRAALSLDFTSGTAPWAVTIRRGETTTNDTILSNIAGDLLFSARVVGNGPTRHRVISITDANGCPGDTTSGSAWVSYLTSPSAIISGLDSICPGENAMLTVTLSSTSTPPWNFVYLTNGLNPTPVSVIAGYSHSLPVSGAGIYTLAMVQDQVCTGKVSGTGEARTYTVPTAIISGNATICEHTSTNLSIALTGKSNWKFSYRLNGGDPTEVLNVTSPTYVVPVRNAGTYTLYEVFDRNCKGTVSGSAVINVTPAPDVTLTGLAPAYNKQSTVWVPLTGNPSGGTYSGPGIIPYNLNWYFVPSLPAVGTHNIIYSYRTSPTSCYGYDTVVVRVLEANAVIEFPKDRINYCNNDLPFTITGVNLADVTGSFSIEGGVGLTDNHDNTATIDPSLLNNNQYTVTYSYFDGTTLSVNSDFNVGNMPDVDFTWETECFHEGQSVLLKNLSVSTYGNLTDTSYLWRINTSTGYEEYTTRDVEHTFPQAGNHTIRLQIENSFGCVASLEKEFGLRPTRILAGETYTEDFETKPLTWRSGTSSTVNSWELGEPVKHGNPLRGFTGNPLGVNCWYTDLPLSNPPKEDSWVTSPCFDFTDMEKPMVKIDIWRLFNALRDGATLQASADSGKTWILIGQLNDGVNWFNEYQISGNPGEQKIGWSNIRDAGWIEARHSLDILKGKTDVQFRIAYGSDGTAIGNDGIAFDNFWIGERNRISLIEHFTNSSDDRSARADSTLNDFVNDNKLNVIDLQYHTSSPSGDPFYEDNPVIPTAREFYYGIPGVPYYILNGGTSADSRFDYDPLKVLDTNRPLVESLKDSKFEIRISSQVRENTLTTDVQVSPFKEMPAEELSLRIAVIEQVISDVTGNNGITTFESVVKTLLPDAAGTTLYRTWSLGESVSVKESWNLENVHKSTELRVVAFIQNESTREVYQAEIDTIGVYTGINNPLPGPADEGSFIVYPNPAKGFTYIKFAKETTDNVTMELYNSFGGLVYTRRVPAGTEIAELPVEEFPSGLYLLRLVFSDKLMGTCKLTISK